jgi:signal transduction histidine kinase
MGSPEGALAVLPGSSDVDQAHLKQAIAHVGLIAGLLLSRSRLRRQVRFQNQQLQVQRAARNQLLARFRRGALLVDPNGTLEALNDFASTLLHWPPEDVVGRPVYSLLDELGPLGQKIVAALQTGSKKGEATGPLTARMQRPGKRGSEVTFAIEPIQGMDGYFFVFLEDQEQAIMAGETQHHLDRLALLGRMSAMVAHDLRNPVSSILWGVETLNRVLGEDHPEHSTIKLLLQEGERIHRIIDDILTVSRQPSLMITLCSIQTLMEQVYETYQRSLSEKNIQFRRYYDRSLPLIEGDTVRLGQMLGNLIGNAIDALDQGGVIEVVLRPLGMEQMVACQN